MAIDHTVRYPGQVDAPGAQYPYGRARNVDSPGSGDGTPWEKDLANDILGLQQALLVHAVITPSGAPERADASQYLDAIKKLTKRVGCSVALTGSNLAENAYFTQSIANQTNGGGFTITTPSGVSNLVLPSPGLYAFALQLPLFASSTDDPLPLEMRIENNADHIRVRASRWSSSTLNEVQLVGTGMLNITDEADMNRVRVLSKEADGGLVSVAALARLSVWKISGGNITTGW